MVKTLYGFNNRHLHVSATDFWRYFSTVQLPSPRTKTLHPFINTSRFIQMFYRLATQLYLLKL